MQCLILSEQDVRVQLLRSGSWFRRLGFGQESSTLNPTTLNPPKFQEHAKQHTAEGAKATVHVYG